MTAPNLTHPDPGMVFACPGCDRASLKFRQLTRDFRCNLCAAVTNDPIERAAVTGASGKSADTTRAAAHYKEDATDAD